VAKKYPINPDDPYDPQQPVDGPEGPAAPNPTDPNAPIPPAPPAPPPVTTDPAYPKPGAPPVGTPLPNEPGYSYLGGSRSYDERTGTYRTAEEMARLDAEKNAPYAQWNTGGYARPAFTSTTYNKNAVSGYDPAKWNDPLHQTPKYVVGRILSGYNLNDPQQLQAAMNDIIKAYPGSTWGGRDVITIPGIGPVDVIRDFGGESGIAWQPEDGAAPAAAPPSSLTTQTPSTSSFASSSLQSTGPTSPDPFASMGGGVWANGGWLPKAMAEQYGITDQRGTGTDTTTSSTTSTGGKPLDQELDSARREALLKLLGQGPPTAAELQASPENMAYQLQSQRAAERQRAELAERASFEGFGDTGFFDTEVAGINQQRAEGEAGFMGQLAITRMQAQREDLQFAIAQAQQSGQFDLAQQLDRERMNLDAAIQREQMASSERMAANDLALREFLGKAGIDLDRLRLGEDQRQFNYNLGYQYANLDESSEQARRRDLFQ